MFGTDLGMGQLVRVHEGAVQRVLHAGADADLATFGLAGAALGVLFDLAALVIGVDLDLFKQGLDHIRAGQRAHQVFGIHLGTAELGGGVGGLMQQLVVLFAQAVGDADAALITARVRAGRDTVARVITTGLSAETVEQVAAQIAVAKELVEERAAAEQRFQRRRTAPLAPGQFAVNFVAQLYRAAFAGDGYPGPHGGWPCLADVVVSICRVPSPSHWNFSM